MIRLPSSLSRRAILTRRVPNRVLIIAVSLFVLTGTASGTTAGAKLSARLTSKSFTASQAGSVKLVCKFTAPSKHFSYLITRKSGKKWQAVKSVKKSGDFTGSYTTTVRKLFAGKLVKVGSYRLKLTVDSGSKTLSFAVKARPVVPAAGATTKPAPTGAAPVNTTPPSISGTARDGQTLSTSDGSWTGSPAPSLSRQWLRCDGSGANCQPISGATASTYLLVSADDHTTIRVQVTATNSEGSASAQSDPTAAVVPVVTGISSGNNHSCALLSDGKIECWGDNAYGELGNGTTTDSATPVTVSGITDAVQVSVGWQYSCALRGDKTVWCWGDNGFGQLGQGDDSGHRQTPVQVYSSGTTPLTNVNQLSAGGFHACALIGDGTVECWGYDVYGELGDGNFTADSPYPVHVYSSGTTPLTNVVQITTGYQHSCALLSGGTVECWGYDYYGDLGNGTFTTSSPYGYANPVQVEAIGGGGGALSGVGQISSHSDHTCALLTGGTLACWGANYYGELGHGDSGGSADHPYPVQVYSTGTTPLTGVSQVRTGAQHTCAVLAGGTVDCWGYGANGQLGHGDRNDSSYPELVYSSGTTPLASASQLSAGDTFSCALETGGKLVCWGLNTDDQLGTGKIGHSSSPLQVNASGGSALANVAQVVTGAAFTCARLGDGSVWCWGDNAHGQLGNGNFSDSYSPVRVEGVDGTGYLGVVKLTAGLDHVCALLTSGGAVACWGKNDYGQLGNGASLPAADSSVPVQVHSDVATPLANVTDLSANGNHSCALLSNQTLECWGWNYDGQLGNGGYVSSSYAGWVYSAGTTRLTGVIQVSAGVYHTCVVLSGGAVECWGFNYFGELGNGVSGSETGVVYPVTASGISAVAVSAGESHTCAILSGGEGKVDCWGSNWSGELGHGTSDVGSAIPVQVYSSGTATPFTNAAQVSAGDDYTCALLTDASADCWGSNWFGKLGTGGLSGTVYPVATSLSVNAAQVSAGSGLDYQHTCALATAGAVWCWGSDSNSQLGVPGLGKSLYPVGVVGLP